MNKWYTNPLLLFILSVISVLTGIISLLQNNVYNYNFVIIIMFLTPYIGSFFFFSIAVNRKRNLEIAQEKGLHNFYRAYSGLMELTSRYKEAQSIIYVNYQKWASKLSQGASQQDDIFVEFYKEIKRSMNLMFDKVTNRLKEDLEAYYEVKHGKKIKISVCIKQLSECYIKGTPIDRIEVFCIYRDKASYEEGREIGRVYNVHKNTVFQQCMSNSELSGKNINVFIENNIPKAIKNGTYSCENQDEVLIHKRYNKTIAVPIIQNEVSNKHCFGYLCVDAWEDDILELFSSEELSNIMRAYANIVGAYYYEIKSYFPLLFGHVYDIYKGRE